MLDDHSFDDLRHAFTVVRRASTAYAPPCSATAAVHALDQKLPTVPGSHRRNGWKQIRSGLRWRGEYKYQKNMSPIEEDAIFFSFTLPRRHRSVSFRYRMHTDGEIWIEQT